MALYRNIAGIGNDDVQYDNGGDAPYLIDYYDPRPPFLALGPEITTVPPVPGQPYAVDNSIPIVSIDATGGTGNGTPDIKRDFTNPTGSGGALPTSVPVTAGEPPQVLATDTPTTIKNNLLPLLTLAALVVTAIKGDSLLGNKQRPAYIAGLGLLYYGMNKNKPQLPG